MSMGPVAEWLNAAYCLGRSLRHCETIAGIRGFESHQGHHFDLKDGIMRTPSGGISQ